MAGIVIVGSGLAGYNLAREIRHLDGKVPITMVTADSGDSYSKTTFSTALSHGHTTEDLKIASMESQAKFLGVKIHARTAIEEILPSSQQLVCSRRIKLDYGSLVLAMGASPLLAPLQGDGASAVHAMDTLEQFASWSQEVSTLPPGSPVAILGCGHIALEFASEMLALNHVPHIIAPDSWPFQQLLPSPIGEDIARGMAQNGVEFHLGRTATRVDRLPAAKAEQGLRYRITLSNGLALEAGAVLCAIGREANVELATQAGLAVRRGVLVDSSMRASLPHIYALGDIAEVNGLYLPYVSPLIAQAKVLAAVLTGQEKSLGTLIPLVHLKCPLHPLVICPPQSGDRGEWEFESDAHGMTACYKGPEGELLGFALTRKHTDDCSQLLSSVAPAWHRRIGGFALTH